MILADPPSPDATASGLNNVGPASSRDREMGMTSSIQVALVGRCERGGMAGWPSHTQLLCSNHPQNLPGVLWANEMWSLLLGGGRRWGGRMSS